MLSFFWPFKGSSIDAASFEKELSQLSTKINKATAQNELLQQRRRRYKVLWTLYTSFTYILIAAILTLVTGWNNWGANEYLAIAGSPVLIYGVRTALDAYYNYRISKAHVSLNGLHGQREQAIQRLKSATKYDNTQQLLEKYGGSPSAKKLAESELHGQRHSDREPNPRMEALPTRTGIAPPLTANILSRQPPPGISPPQAPSPSVTPMPVALPDPPASRDHSGPGEEFAPNAFTPNRMSPPPALRPPLQYASDKPTWYDRILDVVLGEDETQAKNRIALICESCRLVNGQAPPGVKTLEDVGTWRCSACHSINGVESEESKILKQITVDSELTARPGPGSASPEHSDEVGRGECRER